MKYIRCACVCWCKDSKKKSRATTWNVDAGNCRECGDHMQNSSLDGNQTNTREMLHDAQPTLLSLEKTYRLCVCGESPHES